MTTRAFAFYRLPHQCDIHMVRQGVDAMDALAHGTVGDMLNRERGFVIAPFCVTADYPVLLIHPDEEQTVTADNGADLLTRWYEETVGIEASAAMVCPQADKQGREAYTEAFAQCHDQVSAGRFRKIVLARQDFFRDTKTHPVALFLQACRRYPRMFISLFFAPLSGLWLTATPELLIERDDQSWHTVALAGTMRKEGVWTEKNIGEQRIVAEYVARQLSDVAQQVEETGPATVEAAHLLHLRTDFRFSLRDEVSVGAVVSALHPTPAVCGLPKEEARAFILSHEPCRRYYSGFAGPWRLDAGSHLFVSLRCMTRRHDGWLLFAGGGIVTDSTEASEWAETEEKLLTMRRLFPIE